MRNYRSKISVLLLLLCLSIFTMQATAFGAEGEDADTATITDLAVTVTKSKPNVGETVDLTIKVRFDNGNVASNPDIARVSVDKPYLLKFLDQGTFKMTAVGEATITVKAGGKTQSVKISASAAESLSGAKMIKGVTYLPLTPVIKALGGTVSYDAPTKNYSIQVGATTIAIARGTAKAKIAGKAFIMKGAPIVDKGQTLFTADILVKALGANLQWDAANYRVILSLGAAKLIVNVEKPKPANTTGMYEVAATGDMAGWKILKGHPYEKIIRIYFNYDAPNLSVEFEDIRKVNLNQKVSWTDDYGRKRVNTVGEIYRIYFSLSNGYTSDWLSAKFGDLYTDWLYSSTIDATGLVEQYLTATGQMEAPQYYTTLTPDTVVVPN